MSRTPPNARARLLNAALIALAFALLGLTVWLKRREIGAVIAGKPDLDRMALGFGIYMVALVLTFVRWSILVRALGLPFRLRDALRLGFIGNVFNLVIPGAVGGDVVKAAFLCREQARKTRAIASMVIDRILGLLGLFVLAGLSGLFAWPAAQGGARALIVVVWAAVGMGFLGLAVLFTPALYRPLEWLVSGRAKLEAMVVELVAMASAYRGRLGTIAGVLGMAVGIHSLYVLAFYEVSLALFRGAAPSLADHLLVVPPTLFTTAIPLPFGALGVTEQASEQLFKLVRHPDGAVAMLGYRVLMYAGGLVSACVYLANLRQVRTLEVEVEGGAVAASGSGR
ncbi:MAG TPA: lysylphosphatidylglycerol synthase transmembrane domain-containing protein [Isosphaeraceae bacterium]|jgi:hypothetical protein|nr:lysylphosphatidylglycerol synthase transmembrane domain-containing protein [Isosphaeraceae bacterium]